MKQGFRAFSHTSDVGLEITGPDWASFYSAAAQGLLSLYRLSPSAAPEPKMKVVRSFKARTPEELLVAWLSEIIFLVAAQRQVPAQIEIVEAGPNILRAKLSLNPKARLSLACEIKAATYHGLQVESGPEGFKARVILDV